MKRSRACVSCCASNAPRACKLSGGLAAAASEMDGRHRDRLGYSAFLDRICHRVAGFFHHRLLRRRSASRCAGNLDARAEHRMGLLQASAIDGMGRASLDISVSAQQLVVSVVGSDQFGDRVMDGRSNFTALCEGRQACDRSLAFHAAADLSFFCPKVQRQRSSSGNLASGDLLLSALV